MKRQGTLHAMLKCNEMLQVTNALHSPLWRRPMTSHPSPQKTHEGENLLTQPKTRIVTRRNLRTLVFRKEHAKGFHRTNKVLRCYRITATAPGRAKSKIGGSTSYIHYIFHTVCLFTCIRHAAGKDAV